MHLKLLRRSRRGLSCLDTMVKEEPNTETGDVAQKHHLSELQYQPAHAHPAELGGKLPWQAALPPALFFLPEVDKQGDSFGM